MHFVICKKSNAARCMTDTFILTGDTYPAEFETKSVFGVGYFVYFCL